jgi:hypothetical protein
LCGFILAFIKFLLPFILQHPESDDMAFQQFEKCTVLDSITTPYARKQGVKIILYQHGNNQVNGMIEAGIKEMKDEFRR